jgi:hypothetical protein
MGIPLSNFYSINNTKIFHILTSLKLKSAENSLFKTLTLGVKN